MADITLKKDPKGSVKTDKSRAASKANKKKKRSAGRFVRESLKELKKVSWPSRKELISGSLAVLVIIVLFAIVVGVIDLGLSQLYQLIIK